MRSPSSSPDSSSIASFARTFVIDATAGERRAEAYFGGGNAIDAKAKRVGLSRTEYLRRALERERVPSAAVSVELLARIALLAQDLDDPDVMSGAWS
jgi:hypothetical protein